MDEDKAAVLEMNKRIMIDLQKIELDRSAQIKKLILRFAAALADVSCPHHAQLTWNRPRSGPALHIVVQEQIGDPVLSQP